MIGNIETKEARLVLQSGIYISFTNISEGSLPSSGSYIQ